MTYEEFCDLASRVQIEVPRSVFAQLEIYYAELVAWNERINLTAITERNDVFVKHFLDSMTAARFLPQGASVCDVGTGAGFPGIILKLLRPDLRLTLLDSLNKRVSFLSQLLDKLSVSAECVHSRVEDAGRNPLYRDRFQVVVSRAVARLNTLYEYTLPLVAPQGVLIAYKAHCEEELEESNKVPSLLHAQFTRSLSFELPPLGEARTLIFVKKLGKTPALYPRGKNKERSAPLK